MPSMQEMVRADFEEAVRLNSSCPTELKDALRMRERIPQFVDNLTSELLNAEKMGVTLNRKIIKETVYSITDMFLRCIQTRAEEEGMSELARSVRKVELEGDPIKSKFDENGNADLSEEFGVIITDKNG